MRHIKKMGIIFVVLFLLLPSFIGCVGAYEWSTETVDSEGWIGQYNSIALDSNGYPHIGYSNNRAAGMWDLKYAKWTGSIWSIETVDFGGELGRGGISLAIDSNGFAHISYLDRSNEDLKYAKYNGTGWEIETVDSTGDVGELSSLALNTSGYPHISYRDYTNHDLKYAKWNGTGWEIETIDSTGDVGSYSSIALDSNDYAHISYYNSTVLNLKYAKYNGTGWEIETIDSITYAGIHTSIALDSNDYAHISYFYSTVGALKYAKYNGIGWEIEIIGLIGKYVGANSLVIDSNDAPHISYCDSIDYDLKYAFKGPQISGKTKPFHGTKVVDVKNPKIETRMSGENGEYSTVLKREGNKKYEVHFKHTSKYPKTFHAGVSLTVSANRTEVEELTIIIMGLDPDISYTVTRDGITLNPDNWSKVGSIMTIIETSFSEHTYTITPIILAGDGGGGELPPTEVGAPAVSSRVTEPQKEIATLIFSIRGWFILLFSYLGAVIICRRIGNVLIAGTLGIILPIVIMYLFKFNIFLFEWMIQATGLLGTALAAITMMMYGLIFGFIMELEVID